MKLSVGDAGDRHRIRTAISTLQTTKVSVIRNGARRDFNLVDSYSFDEERGEIAIEFSPMGMSVFIPQSAADRSVAAVSKVTEAMLDITAMAAIETSMEPVQLAEAIGRRAGIAVGKVDAYHDAGIIDVDVRTTLNGQIAAARKAALVKVFSR